MFTCQNGDAMSLDHVFVCGNPARDFEQARAVREAIYRLVTARRLGEEYGEEAIGVVNAAARKPSATPQLTEAGRRIEATPAEALSAIALHAVELLAGPEVPLMKCAATPSAPVSASTDREACGGSGAAWNPAGTRSRRPRTAPARAARLP
jgi:hypothetical protein